jgi:hypothetical protein
LLFLFICTSVRFFFDLIWFILKKKNEHKDATHK